MSKGYQQHTTLFKLVRKDLQDQAAISIITITDPTTFLTNATILHPQESKVSHTYHPNRKQTFMAGRLAAKTAIQALDPSLKNTKNILIKKGVFEFPVLINQTSPPLHISITHSSTTAIAIVTPQTHPCSLDLQTQKKSAHKAILKNCTQKELEELESQNKIKTYNPIHLWSMKESLSKILKTGLMSPLTLYETKDITPIQNTDLV